MSFSTLFTNPAIFILWLAAILIALSIHEFSHAFAAYKLGDSTAKRLGRLTLNPWAHVDLFGLLALVFVHFGWGKPVPYNPMNLKYKHWGEFLVAIAGPASNFILLIVFGILLKILMPILGGGNLLVIFLIFSFFINAALMLFNLIPLPPLDGSKFLFAVLHENKWHSLRYQIEQYGPYVLMFVVFADILLNIGIISFLLDKPLNWIMNLFGFGGIF
ncbi:MAG: site-2 protease family protein [Patescibacteria group bacterium]|nr:site-2 protease family protein [Patescibacteria group bacterium]